MPYDEALAQRVKAALGAGRGIKEKPMFGGITFMLKGKMCVSVGKDRIMCRIDPAIHDSAVQRKGCCAVVMRGRPYRGFVHVAAEAVKTKRDIDYWVALALDYNGRAKSSHKKRKRQLNRVLVPAAGLD